MREIFFAILGLIIGGGSVYLFSSVKLQRQLTSMEEKLKQATRSLDEMDTLRSQKLAQAEALQKAQTKIQSLEIEYHTQISELEADYQAKASQYKQKIQEQQSSLQVYQAQILELQKNYQQQINDEIKDIPLDFQYLQTLLKQQEWQKADIETTRIMLAIANQTISLTPETINNFPCQDLAIIDYLWCQYSNNRFGFSVQKEILSHYFTVQSHPINLNQESWEKVGKLLGWYINEKWPNNHNDLVFSLENAAQGHLPFLPLWQGAWWGAFIGSQGERFNLLMQRIEQCKLHYDQEVRPKAQ
jgi:hypothetical protein